MTKNELTEIFNSINEERLSRSDLEQYEQKLASVYALSMLEIGVLKKDRALYFLERQRPEVSDVSIRRIYDATENGQKLIEYETTVKAISKMHSSIRSRIFQTL